MTPRFASVARERIQAAGGQLIGRNVYFGDYLDLPPYVTVVEKATRILGVTPTKLETALSDGFTWYQDQPRRSVDYTFEDRLLGASV